MAEIVGSEDPVVISTNREGGEFTVQVRFGNANDSNKDDVTKTPFSSTTAVGAALNGVGGDGGGGEGGGDGGGGGGGGGDGEVLECSLLEDEDAESVKKIKNL